MYKRTACWRSGRNLKTVAQQYAGCLGASFVIVMYGAKRLAGGDLVAHLVMKNDSDRGIDGIFFAGPAAAEHTMEAPGPGGGEPTGPLEPRFRRTAEVFIDPTTHHRMRVWVDPDTGERRYLAEG